MHWFRAKDKKSLASFLFATPVIAVFFVLVIATGAKPVMAAAGTNQQLSFSGKLVKSDGTNITNGTYNMEFKIYQDGTSAGVGSTLEWTEDYLVAGSSGMPSTGGVTLTSGTFQVNFGSICALSGGTCGAKTNTGIDFNQQTLWVSIQIGNTSACTVTSSTTSFNTACGGDGEMSPYIRLTAVPQALNSDKLDGLDSTAFGQLGATQGWTGTNTFQPGTNIVSTVIKQNSNGTPTADILDVQTQNATNILQVTGPALNEAAVTISSVGATRDLTLGSSSGTIKLSSATTSLQKAAATFALDVSNGASNSTLTISNTGGAGNITLSLDTGGVYAVGASTGSTTTCSGGQFLQNPVTTGGIVTGGSCVAGGGGGVTAIGTFSNTSIANGASIASTTLTLGAADTTNPGGVSTTTQSFAGNKTFTGSLTVQNASSQNVISIDPTGTLSGNLINNPSIESAISGNWAQKGSGTGTAVTQDATQQYYGSNSLKIVSGTAVTTDGAKQTLTSTLTASTQYNVLLYTKRADNTSPTLKVVYSIDGTAESVTCSLQLQLTANAWQRYFCTFTTPSSGITASNAIFLELTTASQTIYVDAVAIQLSSTASTTYKEGNITLQGTIVSPLILQDDSNSQTAFTVNNKDGGQVFSIDTSDTNLVQNPGFEANTVGWAAKAGGAGTPTIIRDTSRQKYGIGSMLVTTTANANDGAKYTLPVTITGTGAQAYSLSFSMLLTANALHNFVIVGATTNASDGTVCTNAQLSPVPSASVNVTGGTWVRYACTWTPANAAAVTTVYISQSDTTARSFYLDGVQLEQGSAATSYGLGQISLSAPIITPLQLKNQSDANNALQVQNAAGLAMFTVDNVNKIIQVGSSITDANAVILVVDSYNQATDPTGVNGAMYYNTSTSTFRCFQGSAWRNCLGGGSSNQSTSVPAAYTAGTDTYMAGSQIPLPAGGFRGPTGTAQDGSKITWRLILSKTAAGTAASTITIRVGTAGSTADTARCTAFSTGTPNATADIATIYITVYATAGGSTTTLNCSDDLTHPLAATGWAAAYFTQAYSTQASFDSTPAGTKIGLSFNGGTAMVVTAQSVDVITSNL